MCVYADTADRSASFTKGNMLTIIGPNPFDAMSVLLSVRTRASNVILMDFDGKASLSLHEGSVVYRRKGTATESALTVMADANLDDGVWHDLEVVADLNKFTQVSNNENSTEERGVVYYCGGGRGNFLSQFNHSSPPTPTQLFPLRSLLIMAV